MPVLRSPTTRPQTCHTPGRADCPMLVEVLARPVLATPRLAGTWTSGGVCRRDPRQPPRPDRLDPIEAGPGGRDPLPPAAILLPSLEPQRHPGTEGKKKFRHKGTKARRKHPEHVDQRQAAPAGRASIARPKVPQSPKHGPSPKHGTSLNQGGPAVAPGDDRGARPPRSRPRR